MLPRHNARQCPISCQKWLLARNGWNWADPYRPDTNWLCSLPNQVYAWCGIWLARIDGNIDNWDEYTEDNGDTGNQIAIRFAFENAQISAAVQDFRGDTLVILGYKEEYEYEDPEEDFDEVYLTGPWSCDDSCQNMDGAVQAHIKDLDGRKPDVIIVCKGYNPMIRGALLPVRSDYFPEERLSELEIKIACSLHNNEEVFCITQELIEPCEWENVSIEELLKLTR